MFAFGGLDVVTGASIAGGLVVTGGASIMSGGLSVTSGGLTIAAGNETARQ